MPENSVERIIVERHENGWVISTYRYRHQEVPSRVRVALDFQEASIMVSLALCQSDPSLAKEDGEQPKVSS